MKGITVVAVVAIASFGFAQSPASVAEAVAAKLKGANSVSCSMAVKFPGQPAQRWSLEFLKPNLYRIVSPDQEFHSDGELESSYILATKQFRYGERKGSAIDDAPFAIGLNGFFANSTRLDVTGGGPAQFAGKQEYLLKVQEPGFTFATNLYVDPVSYLPLGYDEPMQSGQFLAVRYIGLTLDSKVNPADLAWKPPTGARPMQAANLASQLLKIGDGAPPIAATTTAGVALDFGKEFGSHRATLLYFSVGQPSISDCDAIRQLFMKASPQRLQIIVIYSRAKGEAASGLGDLPVPVVADPKGDIAKAYGVRTESEFIVGADGKIAATFLGYDPGGIAQALDQRGFRI